MKQLEKGSEKQSIQVRKLPPLLKAFFKEVAISSPFGIQQTSVTPASI